jgi:hypothetical protein
MSWEVVARISGASCGHRSLTGRHYGNLDEELALFFSIKSHFEAPEVYMSDVYASRSWLTALLCCMERIIVALLATCSWPSVGASN